MKIVSGILGLVIACGMFASTGNAAVTLTFGAAPTFVADSGIQSINVFANSSLVAGEASVVLGADFTLGGGALFNSPNAGTFGGPGFIGNGNLDPTPGASTFDRDTTPAFFNTGYLNINFNSAQTVTNSSTPLATLLVNTNGLTQGNYTISVTSGFFGAGTIADTSSSFNITAVPEPGTILTVGLCAVGFWYRQRRAKKLKQPSGVEIA